VKIEDVNLPPPRNGRAAPPRWPRGIRERVLAHLSARPDEVFAAKGDEVAKALGAKASTVSQALWSLARDGFAAKARMKSGVWYGSHAAIEALAAACEAQGLFCEPL
jgi:hypothetical protein